MSIFCCGDTGGYSPISSYPIGRTTDRHEVNSVITIECFRRVKPANHRRNHERARFSQRLIPAATDSFFGFRDS
jgi:hypothetical protein